MISIIIPTLNEEKAIVNTLSRLKELNAIEHEVIVSDGKSTDKTAELARPLADHVIVYSGEARQTIAGGRNLGALSAKGEYLLFLDADITLFHINDFLQTIVAEFDNDKELVGATVRLTILPENATLTDRICSTIFIDSMHYTANNILKTGSASGEFQFIRKSVFDKLGGYNENLVVSEDNDLFMRLAKVGKTKMFWNLRAYHSGRRFHKLGWPKVLWLWLINLLSVTFFKKAASKEWKPIR